MTVEFHTGDRYIYYGDTKKDAEKMFLKKFGNYTGFVSREFEIVEK